MWPDAGALPATGGAVLACALPVKGGAVGLYLRQQPTRTRVSLALLFRSGTLVGTLD